MKILISADASFRRKMGFIGIVISIDGKHLLRKFKTRCSTSTQAEALALLQACYLASDILLDFPDASITIRSDSQSVVNAYNFRCGRPLDCVLIFAELRKKRTFQVRYVPRLLNLMADDLAYADDGIELELLPCRVG